MLRVCDAVGACIAVPDSEHYRDARRGDTLGPRRRRCAHWIRTNSARWIEQQRAEGWLIVAVELADGAVALPRLEPARRRTLILLGHEWRGILEEQVGAADVCVEIPVSDEGACARAGWRT